MRIQKTILVCPLDWGLGHATRCIPLIYKLIKFNCKVIIGAAGKQKIILQQEFPNLFFIELKGYEVEYSKKGIMAFKILSQLPKIKKSIDSEHRWLDTVVEKYNIDIVISDNRYGLWSKKIKSILMTHQLFVKAPIGEGFIEKQLWKYFDKFNEIWIPDVEFGLNLSGDLSHKKKLPEKFKFIGLLSRFSLIDVSISTKVNDYKFDFMAIVSGPEPQRTTFENEIIQQSEQSNLKGVILRGMPDEEITSNTNTNLTVFNHLNSQEFLKYIISSKIIISRSGYSTLMDLAVLNKKAVLIPTPGQTEQEYLAKFHSKKLHWLSQPQCSFKLVESVKKAENYSGLQIENALFLESIIRELVNQ